MGGNNENDSENAPCSVWFAIAMHVSNCAPAVALVTKMIKKRKKRN